MRRAWDVETIRAAEKRLMATLPEGTLMQRAASGLASVCAQLLQGTYGQVYGSRVVLLVGSGDNGGDALFAGARLAGRGARVDALLISDLAHESGISALRRAGGVTHLVVNPEDLYSVIDDADLVLDGIVGIGGKGSLREPAAALVRRLDEGGPVVVAVDLPSGIDADIGEVAGQVVSADVTVTFGALKPGLLMSPGHDHVGVLTLIDIGLTDELADAAPAMCVLDADDVAALLPRAHRGDHKYSRGVVGIVAGSTQMPGAAMLTTGGARVGGVGMVRVLDHNAAVSTDVVTRYPDIVLDSTDPVDMARVDAWVCGPGLGRGDAERELVRRILDVSAPVVLDADALFHLHDKDLRSALLVRRDRGLVTVTTPHEGEFVRLIGPLGADRVAAVRGAAADLGVIMLLKGSTTVIAAPGGHAYGDTRGDTYVNTVAAPELATAGSGDVLAGLIGALLASGRDQEPLELVAAAAYLHGLAGSRLAAGGRAFTAGQLPDAIAAATADLRVSGRMSE
jgi:hydroxyethylthiazole kinase-like uncharacterized protein yjeF